MIQKVSFRNFKAYRSLDLELEPLTVLVGPNASGKTTLLQGLHLATNLVGDEDPVLLGSLGETALHSRGSTKPIELSLSGKWSKRPGFVRIEIFQGVPGSKLIVGWADNIFEGEIQLSRGADSLFGKTRYKSEESVDFGFQYGLLSTSVLRLSAQALAEPSYSDDSIPEMNESGAGLASVLAYLKLSKDEVFEGIEQAIKQIVPSVLRIRLERAAVERTTLRTIALDEQRHQVPEQRSLWGNRVVLDMKGAKGVAVDSAGEGTLMALGLLTFLMGPDSPRLVLLDDIELNLHPVAQGKLIETLRKLQERDPGLQIIATSHSPFILNYLKPEEVRMTFLSEDGSARCEKLTAHPEFDRWKDLMSPGEFWSTVGESWVEKVKAPEQP